VLEGYADRLQSLEDRILHGASDEVLPQIHRIKRELVTLRRTVWPVKDMVKQLRPELSPFISPMVEPYLRDVHDHVDQLLDLIETYHTHATSLVELHLSLCDHKANDVMKVLTVVGAIFLPLTFVTGLYGMNFDTHSRWNMPELGWTYGYEYALGLMLLMTIGMLWYFWRKRWL
jgi:magnesium transporter